jgi:cellobiose-specific phosphotransferase system component IIC
MASIFERLDAWIIAVVLAAAMVTAWRIGWLRGRKQPTETDPPGAKAADASLALLGLLLAFTFSMSLTKHDERRMMVLTEANAIGDFYTCATLLKDPSRQRLQTVIRDYVQYKLDTTHEGLERGPGFEAAVQRDQDAQARMTESVSQALADGTPIAVPLTNTLNNVTSSHAARILAVHDRLPWSIVVLLFLAAVVALLLMGEQQGATRKPNFISTASLILVVTLVVYVTLDLNQPSKGLITVSQEPMERLLATM